MPRPTALVLPLALALLLAGCGGGGGNGAGETGPEASGTIPGAAGVTIEDEGAATQGPFQSTEFEPPVGFTVPADWRVREEFGTIQAFRGAGEAQALTFESTGEGTLEQRVQEMRGTADLQASEPEELEISGHDARRFEAEPDFAMAIEGSEYFALGQGPVRVWVVDVDGQLVTIFAETSILRTERREADQVTAEFFSEVDRIIQTVEFGSSSEG